MVESPGAGSMYLLVAMCLLYTYFILKIEHYFEKKISNRQPESQSLREFLYGLNKEKGGGYTYFSNEEKIVQI